ncbi:MAG: hypothetical protein KJ620_00850 [Candidatus Edwardsbacteria bacterium]|nr:hypothetical protein [Candidatus Edwardsbacteria bacterium]MBU1576464.1 hypothetical protein [Candidatus Edwardsbacteria bacterium]MBU2464477.1 hypothetical protein [Candidatus Edwardsbacteria bacterium]MBU2594537.1 hypothetical protein [Candidatus Edwardsbacteria bacterium]
MRVLKIAVFFIAAFLIVSCGPKSEKKQTPTKQQVVKEAPLPDGYPAELAIPEGFTAKNISVGNGTSSGGGQGVRTYATYRIEKLMAGEKTALVEHYKKILAENNWKGEMKTPEAGYGYGTFAKDNMELELKMNDVMFAFNLKVYKN